MTSEALSQSVSLRGDTAPSAGRRGSPVWGGLLFCALAIWTLLISTVPDMRFQIFLPRARLPIETVGVVVTALASMFAYVRYSVGGSRRALFLSIAFLILSFNHLVFGLVIQPGRFGISPATDVYLWTAGRLWAGSLFLAGAVGSSVDREPRARVRRFVIGGLAALSVVAVGQFAIWLFRNDLPALFSGSVSAANLKGVLPGLTAVDFAMGSVGAAVFLAAAIGYLRSARRESPVASWLVAAFVLAAFSHLHYMLAPTVFTNQVSTGDFLRLAFAITILIGLVWEVREVAVAEHRRAAELEEAYETERVRLYEVRTLERARADLVAMVSHELMHPVAAIRSMAVSLARRWSTLDEATRLEIVERIDRESARLRDLAEESAAAVQLEAPTLPLTLTPCAAVDLVREASSAVAELDGRLRLQLERGTERALVMADRSRMVQVLRNLLSNASKYSSPDSAIEMWLAVEGRDVVFVVSDRGPGIEQEDLGRLFERFSRVRNRATRDIPGSGLGLYVSRKIVEAHGGRVWAESTQGWGSMFGVALPLMGHDR